MSKYVALEFDWIAKKINERIGKVNRKKWEVINSGQIIPTEESSHVFIQKQSAEHIK